jgi:hypothetical protein
MRGEEQVPVGYVALHLDSFECPSGSTFSVDIWAAGNRRIQGIVSVGIY